AAAGLEPAQASSIWGYAVSIAMLFTAFMGPILGAAADYSGSKKRFMGWKIEIINEDEEIEFVSETKLKIYNNGFSTIKHDITLETKEETKYQLSATGSIKVSVDGNIKKFKGAVDADIKASVSYSSVKTSDEKYEFEIIVDPQTYVKIITRGKGIINNGVGKYYFFWINTKEGGWETFTLTTEYYEIVKDRI
ncbi:MAG TPA: hypothetical protein PK113_05570, partial [Bacillota bacterium]|nr:hypothetical protein [Bacillota bacterium]